MEPAADTVVAALQPIPGGLHVQSEYRGHRIVLVAVTPWSAEFQELASGARLPTRLVAIPGESLRQLWARSRGLIDRYLEAPDDVRVLSPVRPWQTLCAPAQEKA